MAEPPKVTIERGIPADQQESSFMNATLQTAGDSTVSIATYIAVPDGMSESDVAHHLQAYLRDVTRAFPVLSFHVQVGPTDEIERG